MVLKKILIIGGAGFIGSNLVIKLLSEGYNVHVFTRSGRSVKNLGAILHKIKLIYGDIMDEIALKNAINGVDIVIHLVSTTFPATSSEVGTYEVTSNLIPTIRILDYCVAYNIEKFIYASSGGTIYGDYDIPIEETFSLNPKSMYGLSKMNIEAYINYFRDTYQLNTQILRISNPFGPYQNPYGAQGIIATAFRSAIDNTTLKVFGSGNIVRDYLFIDDVVEAFLCALKSIASQTVNISSGSGRSINQVIQLVENVTNKKLLKEYIDFRKGDVLINVLSNDKALRVYDWTPSISFEEGLMKTWNWIKKEFRI
jgi:UDP-glucose 4-epimerase